MSKNKTKQSFSGLSLYVTVLVLDIVFGGIWYYFAFPAINIHNREFFSTLIAFITIDMLIIAVSHVGSFVGKKLTGKEVLKKIGKDAVTVLVIDAIIIFIFIGGSLAGAQLFRSRSYANLINIEQRDFTEDIKESNSVTNIALMDTDSAQIFGDREVGSLSDVVSQYEVEDDYTQINIKGSPMKVSTLKYASFFKWFKNRSEGVPGYVKVNPVNSDSSYVKLEKGLKYVPSGYFNDNLMRHVQYQYPTKIIDGYYFEVDDKGNPYYVCPTITARIGLFDGMDVNGAIVCDPVTGQSKYYFLKDIPTWVDRVFDGDLCTRKYDWYGNLKNGFWNSKINQTGCTKTTDDYGYITIEDDVWVYTGVTSMNSDKSNVGFVLMNQRTGESRYYTVSGAEENSAMHSAEGAVQEKKYEASFPCLINVNGQPTYIMVLKDRGGLVKMYAMVNVEQYNIVATGTSQGEVFSTYKKMLREEGIKTESSSSSDNENDDTETEDANYKEITIADIQYITLDGETYVYLKDEYNHVYKENFADNEQLITLNKGDKIQVNCVTTEDDITEISDFKK